MRSRRGGRTNSAAPIPVYNGHALLPAPLPQSAARTAALKILDYHQRSKHALRGYAPGPGFLDWDNQPDPFRLFAGAPRTDLPLGADRLTARYGDLRCGRLPPPAPFDCNSIGILFQLALGLSAWKQQGAARWALRCNPSSGNLHPTEAYLLSPELPGIAAGVHHYLSRDHTLEHRAAPIGSSWNSAFTGQGVLVGIASIFWREAWKYGMRAFRYCQLDCGHALGALAYAAAALGWHAQLNGSVGDDGLGKLLGSDRDADFRGAEREVPDCLVWLSTTAEAPRIADLIEGLQTASWHGRANRLSAQHRNWPDIEFAHDASRKPETPATSAWQRGALPRPGAPRLDVAAQRVIRQRRSAVAFDGETEIDGEPFFAMLDTTMPRPEPPPWSAWHEPPAVHLALFVHRVRGLEPGLYFLLRARDELETLRHALHAGWQWDKVGPAHLPLYLLQPHDLRETARLVSCHQAIAADSCFALGMLARMGDVAAEPWRYRQRYWECGMIGQALYLEAEAAGMRGTGIGCFFDDEVHRLLGLRGTDWQSLYHFTVGSAVEDPRLRTLAPYSERIAIDGPVSATY